MLRLVGRYSQMMKVLTPIVEEVWRVICQQVEFYLYMVNVFFSTDLLDTEQNMESTRLNNHKSPLLLH